MARKPNKRPGKPNIQPDTETPLHHRAEVENEPFVVKGLTCRQKMFVDAMVGPAAGNATKAAEMAGYRSDNRNSLSVTACETLRKPNVQMALAHAYAKLRNTPEWAKANLVSIASSSVANFLKRDEDGNVSIDFAEAERQGALGQIKEYREESVGGGNGPVVTKRTIKLHDALAATGMMLKLHGLMVEKHELSGTVEVSPVHATMGRLLKDPKTFGMVQDLAQRVRALKKANGADANGHDKLNGSNGNH